MAEETTGGHIGTSSAPPISNYQPSDQDFLSHSMEKTPVSTVPATSSQYTVTNVTSVTEEVVLVVHVGATPRRDQIRELNAKLQGVTSFPLSVSSGS